MEENQQDFHKPIVVGEEKDLIVQRNTSMVDGLYAQRTSYHVSMVANAAELPW